MTGFLKVPCQPSMADPHLRPKGLLRDRRAGAQSHVRGYRSSCGPHLASSGAAAASASLPTRSGMRAISAAVAVLASRGTGPRETSSLRRPRSLPEQARACPEIARDTGVPPSLRHAGLPRARTQAPSMRGLRTSAQPFPGMRPSLRLSALELSEGARPRWDAVPRAHGRVNGRPRVGGPGDPLGLGPRPVAGDLGRLGGRESREAVPATQHRPVRRGAAGPGGAGTGASRARRSACARPATCRVGTGSHPRAGAPPRGRRPGRPSPGPARAAPGPLGDALAGPASPARASRARPPASRPSSPPGGRESAGPERPRGGHEPRRRAYRRGSRVAADPEACTMDGHGDPPVGRGASAPPCRDGTIPAHGRSPWDPDPEISSTPSVRVISSSIAPTSPIIIDIPPVRLARGGWHR